MIHTYTIIPDLVTINTNLTHIKDFLLSRNLSFYKSNSPQKYHYQLAVQNQVKIPPQIDIRIGNFTITGSNIYFQQNVWDKYGFKFSYDFAQKIFNYNIFYKYHFINLGNVFTIGRNLYHLIEYELAKEKIFIVLGAVVAKNNRTITLLAPNGNNKTTFVNSALSAGYSYVSENFFVLDLNNKQIYGISPVLKHMNKISNNTLSHIFMQNNINILPKTNIGEIYFLAFDNMSIKKTIISNYLETYCQYYKKNNFTRSLIYLKQENEILDRNYHMLSDYLTPQVKTIKNYTDIKL